MNLTCLALFVSEMSCRNNYDARCSDLNDDESRDSSSEAATYLSILLAVPNVISLVVTSYL